MFLFDTNHISVWQRGEGASYERLCTHLEKHTGEEIFVSVVLFHEMVNGWNAYIVRRSKSESLVRAYFEFERILKDFSVMQLLPFDRKAAEVFDELARQRLRTGAWASDRGLAPLAASPLYPLQCFVGCVKPCTFRLCLP